MEDFRCPELDPCVRKAYEEAQAKMNIGPLIKEELKLTILNRRHIRGMPEIVSENKRPTVKRELTEEEVQKKLRRKEQNRRAAERCRHKKKMNTEQLMREYEKEQQTNELCRKEIEFLRKQVADLQRILHEHPCTLSKTLNETPAYDNSFYTFPYVTCPTPSHQQELVSHRDTQTPFQQDTLDDISDLSDLIFLPEPCIEKDVYFVQPPTCTAQPTLTEFLPDISLPEGFDVYQLLAPE